MHPHSLKRSRTFLMLLTMVGMMGCGNNASNFVVLPGARDVHVRHEKTSPGYEQVNYRLNTEYPADTEIAKIRQQLKKRNWRELDKDPLNAGYSTKFTWQIYEDRSGKEPQKMYHWSGDWENKAHDLLRYDLMYRFPLADQEDLKSLQVIGTYTPLQVFQKMQAIAAEFEKKHPENIK